MKPARRQPWVVSWMKHWLIMRSRGISPTRSGHRACRRTCISARFHLGRLRAAPATFPRPAPPMFGNWVGAISRITSCTISRQHPTATSIRASTLFRGPMCRDASLEAWRRGRTGVPIVDAGMRELWTTGWMHNRVRMIVASFLTKNLRAHWHHGTSLVLGHVGRCRPGQQHVGMAMGRGYRRRCRAVCPRLQSGPAVAALRCGRRLHRALGSGTVRPECEGSARAVVEWRASPGLSVGSNRGSGFKQAGRAGGVRSDQGEGTRAEWAAASSDFANNIIDIMRSTRSN